MILDEATCSIDTRTEAIVQAGMDKPDGRPHRRLSSRTACPPCATPTRSWCLDHGRIIERGDHDELIAERGYYYQLYTGAFELE